MDPVSNWKRILLQWIKQCNFLDKQFYRIEQFEAEDFFLKFRDQIKLDVCNNYDLPTFLKEHYPQFELVFDDENALSSSDYVYVYSLLLHFSCVKCPDEFFQKKCQQLNESAQNSITTFFKKLLETNSLTKETLRHVIASIGFFKATNIPSLCMESPMKTPRKSVISPTTPRSCQVQERKNLLHLKAQLDNESYEKGILEIEVKEHQEKIANLNKELKRCMQELQDLKNDALSRNTEIDFELRTSEDEQLSRRLNKQISQKEAEIARHCGYIDELTEQKAILNEKLNLAEHQIKTLEYKVAELHSLLDEQSEELEKKEVMIHCLQEAKIELEHYVSEIRSSSASSRPDLNMSIECLDISRTTNSSGSLNSPENLGCSVVDIQLREKEHENIHLRQEIAMIRLDNSKLSRHMADLTVHYSQRFEICDENLIIDHDINDPMEHFIVFSNYVENFVHKYEESCLAINELKERIQALDEQNHNLTCSVNAAQSELVELGTQIENLNAQNKAINLEKTCLESAIAKLEKDLDGSATKHEKVVEQLEMLQKEFENLKTAKVAEGLAFEKEIDDLNVQKKALESEKTSLETAVGHLDKQLHSTATKHEEVVEHLESLQKEFGNLKTSKVAEDLASEKEIDDLNVQKKALELEKTSLETAVGNLAIELDRSVTKHNEVLEQLESLQKEFENLKTCKVAEGLAFQKEIDDLNGQKNALELEKTSLKTAVGHLEKELNSTATKHEEVFGQLESLQKEFENLKTSKVADGLAFEKELGDLNLQKKTLELEKTSLETAVGHLEKQLDSTATKHEEAVEHLESLQKEFENLKTSKVAEDLAFENEIDDLNVQKKALELERTSLETAVGNLAIELDRSAEKHNEVLEQLESLQKEFENLKTSKAAEGLAFEKAIEDLNGQKKALELEKTTLETAVCHLEKQLASTATKHEEVVRQLESLQKEFENIKTSKVADGLAFEKEIDDLNVQKKALELEKTSLESTVGNLEKELKGSETKHEDVVQQLEGLQRELLDITNRFQQSELKNQDLEKQITDLEYQSTNKEKHLLNEMQAVKLEMQTKCDLVELLENDKDRLTTELEQTRQQVEKFAKSLHDADQSFQQCEAEKQELEKQLADLQSQSMGTEKQLSEQIEKVYAELEQRIKAINQLENDKQRLTAQLNEATKSTECMSNDKISLVRELKENKMQLSLLETVLKETQENHHRLTDDRNQQLLIISQLQADKENLLKVIQNRIDLAKETLEQHASLYEEQVSKLIRTTEELKVRQTMLDELTCKCSNLERVLAEKTESFDTIIDELKSKLQSTIEASSSTTDLKEIDLFPVSSSSNSAIDILKHNLNGLLQKCHTLHVCNVQHEENIANLSESLRKSTQQKIDLERRIHELREDLEYESQSEIRKLTNEVKRLNDDLSNLENVCDHLTKQNASFQSRISEMNAVTDELTQKNILLSEKVSVLETEQAESLTLANKLKNTEAELRAQIGNMQSSANKLVLEIESVQSLLLKKTNDAQTLLQERNEAESRIDSMKKQICELESKVLELETTSTEINKKLSEASKTNGEVETLKSQIKIEVTAKVRASENLKLLNNRIEELTQENQNLEHKCQAMCAELEKCKKDLEASKTELIELGCEKNTLLSKIELANETNISTGIQVEKCNNEIAIQKDNVSQLIKEIASLRKEKDTIEEEKNSLETRLQEKLNTYLMLESNYKSTMEKLQLAEKDIHAKQASLKSEQAKSQDLETQLTKLQLEFTKLKETNENNTKRMEKQALKLGETQAKSIRLKKDAEIAQNALKPLQALTEQNQRENNKLTMECKSLKEKLSKCEKACDQLENKFQLLSREHNELRVVKENLEISENSLKSSKDELVKIKSNLEEKIRKLAKSLSDSNVATSRLEQDQVQLSLEVGGLNNQLQANKSQLNMKIKEIQDVTNNLIAIKNSNENLLELNEKLQKDADAIHEENSRLNDELSKLSLRLQITQEEHSSALAELESLRADKVILKNERDIIENEHLDTLTQLKEVKKLLDDKNSADSEFSYKIKDLEAQLAKTSFECRNLEEMRKHERVTNDKLNTDISILQAKLQKSRSICEENEKKWLEEKEQLLLEARSGDDRIKETRLELEGKLEKMKNKMKTLYNDEITKMKKKQEREVATIKSEYEVLKTQNEKYEEHTKKLSSQIFRLNENILEHQKQNTFLKTKLKDLETKPRQSNRVPTVHTAPSSTHQVISSNLHMEDEEGEVFNNTYLSDLKNGRMSDMFSRDICPQELQYRNSLLPPHLKSTYLAQFDHQMGEDEIRESPSLDDSLSTLLNTGQRKKMSGATSYKRPGPPTPSKNAGRLSFGGNGELTREILKDGDIGNFTLSSKTPAKFKLFSSRLSMKDENKNCMTTFKRRKHSIGTIQCSSTPRKSKSHFDQRCLLDQIMMTANRDFEDSPHCLVSPAVNLPPTLKASELSRRISQKWRQPKLVFESQDSESSYANSPLCEDANYETNRTKRYKDRRSSLHIRGNMFARNGRNTRFRENFKNKSKLQRNATFNKYRRDMMNKMIVRKSAMWPSCAPMINNNSYFVETLNINNNYEIEDSENINICPHLADDSSNDKSSKHFQQLLANKESHAPFEISEIASPSLLNVNSSSTVHSRTIYGASVILNRKIPNVNTTLVRKSSIYVKANDERSIILVTNQTITLMDLAQMWFQMNAPAKIIICLSLTTLCVALLSFVIHVTLR